LQTVCFGCHLSHLLCFGRLCPLNLLCIKLYCVQVSLLGAPVPLVWVVVARFGSTKSSCGFDGPRSTPFPLWEIVLLTLTRIRTARTYLFAWGPALIRRKVTLNIFKLAACKRVSVLRHCVFASRCFRVQRCCAIYELSIWAPFATSFSFRVESTLSRLPLISPLQC
jgi:hypothetical protein